jgi:hypothetical protein
MMVSLFFNLSIIRLIIRFLVFEADDEIVKQEGSVQIEQFVSTKNLTTVENKDEMTFATLLYTSAGTDKPQEFYDTAIGNLKQFSPKLRILHLFGGHTFYPENSVSLPFLREIITEIIVGIKKSINSYL